MKAEQRGGRIDLTVSRWGNSLAVRLPADSLKQLGVGVPRVDPKVSPTESATQKVADAQ